LINTRGKAVMKILVVYESTYGFAHDCAQALAEKLTGEVSLKKASDMPDPSGFDCVIAGGSIYMGKVQKALTQYLDRYGESIKKKKYALFLCCGFAENFNTYIDANFDLLAPGAAAIECFGGELRIERMKFFHKMITNMMLRAENGLKPAANPENIDKLAAVINS